MNQSKAATVEVVKRIVEYEVGEADDVLRGITLDSRRLVVAGGARLVRVVPLTGRVIDQLETFPGPGGLAYDGRYLWQHVEGRFEQLDVRTGLTLRSISPGLDGVTGLECFEGGLLVLHDGGRSLARVEIVPHRGGIVAEDAATDAPLRGLGWSRGELWTSAPGELRAIDPFSARTVARLPLPGGVQACDVTGDVHGRLWSVDGDSRTVRAFELPTSTEWPPRLRAERPAEVHPEYARSGTMPISSVETPAATARPTFARILVPVDFSDDSRRALAMALVLRESFASEVHLFHLAEHGANDEFLAGIGGSSPPPGELVEAARSRLRAYLENLFPGTAEDVVVHAHYGTDVVAGIERAASEVGATLVLLAGRPRQSLFRTRIEKIVRDLNGAVMVVR